MEILSEKSFKTRNHVKVTCRVDDMGVAYLRFEGLYSVENLTARYGKDYPVCFYPEEREAMQTLLAGGKLEAPVTFKKGDIVRFDPQKSKTDFPWAGFAAQKDALALVTSDYDGSETFVKVRWICARSKTQRDGEYYPDVFEVVSEDALTVADREAVIKRALDNLR